MNSRFAPSVLAATAMLGGVAGCAVGDVTDGAVKASAETLEMAPRNENNVLSWPVIGDAFARFAPMAERQSVLSPGAAKGLPTKATVLDTQRVQLSDVLGPALARGGVNAVRFDGRVYLGLRSLPAGAAQPRPRIDVVSSEDEHDWRFETGLTLESELLAPRFLVWRDSVFAYVSELDDTGGDLTPGDVIMSRVGRSGLWSTWSPLELHGQVVWRTKVERGIPLMTSYAAAEKTYQFDEARMEVNLLTTDDGIAWRPLQSGRHAVYRGGGSEAAFSSDDDGNLYSVVRNEAGDESGFGSAICAAEASDWARWDCTNDPKKYDSPTLFTHDGELYLVARRHAAHDGRYDTRHGLSFLRRAENEARDLSGPKRCALWHFDRGHKRIEFVLDLPSKGNTCSPSVIPGAAPNEYVIYDHSSDIDGPDLSLSEGLSKETFVYRHVVRFDAP